MPKRAWTVATRPQIFGQMSDPEIRTSRLLLRRWRAEDVEPFAAICRDPEVMRYIGSGTIRTHEQTVLSVEAFEREWEENGYGLFAVEFVGGDQMIGFTGLAIPTFLPEILPTVELGWRFARPAWGNGYATEAAQAALDFALVELRLPEIVSIFQAGNHASARIVQKLGMRFDRETVDPTCGRPVNVYRATA
jgi:RimJ/RimL family protein N-acetyltransferase